MDHREDGNKLFYKRYPDGDDSMFGFGYNLSGDGKLESIDIYYTYKLS